MRGIFVPIHKIMSNKKKAPMWARLKASKQHAREMHQLVAHLARELVQEREAREYYQKSYEWAMAMIGKETENTGALITMLSNQVQAREQAGEQAAR